GPDGRTGSDGEVPAAAPDGAAGTAARLLAPPSVTHALDLVTAPAELAAAVEELLDGVVVAADLGGGLGLVRAHPRLRVVTGDGDLSGAYWAGGGSAGAPSLLGLRAAAQEAAARLDEAEHRCQRAERELADAAEDEDAARQVLAEAVGALQEAHAAAAETSGRLGTPARRARGAQGPGRGAGGGRGGEGSGPGGGRWGEAGGPGG